MKPGRQATHPAELLVFVNHFVEDILQAGGEGGMALLHRSRALITSAMGQLGG
jgi:hypothetical protein